MTQKANLIKSGPATSPAMITGAAGGLGKAFAVECASRGWDLYLTDLRQDALEALARSIERTYQVKVYTQACDLTDAEARSFLFHKIQESGLIFSAIFNVAGLDFEGRFHDCSRGQILTILRLNLEAALDVTHAILKLRDPLIPFRIINVASLAAFIRCPSRRPMRPRSAFCWTSRSRCGRNCAHPV